MVATNLSTKNAPTTDRQYPVVGTALLAVLRDTIRVAKEEAAGEAGSVAYNAARDVTTALSWVPPSTPDEALAAAIMLYDEASDVEEASSWTEDRAYDWSARMRRRAVALAAWIETAHGVNRTKLGLDYLCSGDAQPNLLPHSPHCPSSGDGAAPLRAGKNAAWDAA